MKIDDNTLKQLKAGVMATIGDFAINMNAHGNEKDSPTKLSFLSALIESKHITIDEMVEHFKSTLEKIT